MQMNGNERDDLAMRFIELDRAPAYCMLFMGHFMLNAGISWTLHV
jgi:hypothetical protein